MRRPERVLVTGGAGFVGSTLVERLLSEDRQVVAFDSFDPFYPEEQKRRKANFQYDGKCRTLSEMAEGIRAIQTSVKGLYAVSEAIEQRVTNTQSRLDTVTQAVRALKVVKKNAPKKKQPPVISKPPFHIDAIDLWDDVTYVAISQSGRAAFLKAGEQQAGWAVTRIDRLKGEVGFRGPAGQAYLASLGR